MVMRLDDDEKDNHVFIDDYWGGKVKLRTFSKGEHLKGQ